MKCWSECPKINSGCQAPEIDHEHYHTLCKSTDNNWLECKYCVHTPTKWKEALKDEEK